MNSSFPLRLLSRPCRPMRIRLAQSSPLGAVAARRLATIEVATSSPKESALSDAALSGGASGSASKASPEGLSICPSSSTASDSSTSASHAARRKQPKASRLLPYHISRTPTNNLPVYTDTRNGGTRKETIVRKISGNPRVLRDELIRLLGKDKDTIWVGNVTGHVYLKGHHKPIVERFLQEKGF